MGQTGEFAASSLIARQAAKVFFDLKGLHSKPASTTQGS
jgi:hypothetical protein